MTAKEANYSIVGTSVRRVDGADKVTGKAKYTGDLVVPGLIEGKFLRSPYAHARIVSIDTSEAEAMAGVVAVLTRKDFTDISPYIGRGKTKDHPIIALERAIFAGQPVAAVAALDRATAEEAMGKIHVEYEELKPVIDVDEAMADGAPLVHDFAPRNICFQTELVKGNVEQGFAEADEIFEDSFEFPMIFHYSMEPHTAIAQLDSDGIQVWTSTGQVGRKDRAAGGGAGAQSAAAGQSGTEFLRGDGDLPPSRHQVQGNNRREKGWHLGGQTSGDLP